MEKKNLFDLSSLTNINDLSPIKAFAMAAGDMSTAIRQEAVKIMKANQNNVLKSFSSILQMLLERKLISDDEKKQLQKIFSLLLKAIRETDNAEDAYFSIKKIYNEMIIMHDASPVALALLSVASSCFNFQKSNSLAVFPDITAGGVLVGAATGAYTGFVFGGSLGATIGLIVGAALGGLLNCGGDN